MDADDFSQLHEATDRYCSCFREGKLSSGMAARWVGTVSLSIFC